MSAKPNQSNEFIHFLISELCDKFLSVAFFQHHSDKHGTMERKRHFSDSAHLGEISEELMLLDNSRFTTTINLKNAGTFVRFFFSLQGGSGFIGRLKHLEMKNEQSPTHSSPI